MAGGVYSDVCKGKVKQKIFPTELFHGDESHGPLESKHFLDQMGFGGFQSTIFSIGFNRCIPQTPEKKTETPGVLRGVERIKHRPKQIQVNMVPSKVVDV